MEKWVEKWKSGWKSGWKSESKKNNFLGILKEIYSLKCVIIKLKLLLMEKWKSILTSYIEKIKERKYKKYIKLYI